MATYLCITQLQGALLCRPPGERILSGVVRIAAPFLLDQINKHRTPLSSERDNMSVLLSGHYALEMSSWKVYEMSSWKVYDLN